MNCAYKGNGNGTPLGDLVHDFCCANPRSMRHNVLKERASRLKGGGEEVAMVSESIDRLIAESKDLWIAEGLEEGRKKVREQVADLTGLSLEEVDELANG